MQLPKRTAAQAREFWVYRINRAIAMMTDAELACMANDFTHHRGAIFVLELVHADDSSCVHSHAVVHYNPLRDRRVADN
jgi:hypothetical protein